MCCHAVHLTGSWLCAPHIALFTLIPMVPDIKSINYQIRNSLVESKCCDSDALLLSGLYWINYSFYSSSFVRWGGTPSSSLCHVQSPRSSRPQIGCLSNTESFDKWLHPWMVLDFLCCRILWSSPVYLLTVSETEDNIVPVLVDERWFNTCGSAQNVTWN